MTSYLDAVINNCKQAKIATPSKEKKEIFVINIDTIYADLKWEEIEDFKNVVYVIEQVGGDLTETKKTLASFKERTKRACSKINKPICKTLYVGSSTTGFKTRLKQHLGYGGGSTYALHLCHWFEGKIRITAHEYDEPKQVIQLIEDALSNRLKPMFGKMGGNNK